MIVDLVAPPSAPTVPLDLAALERDMLQAAAAALSAAEYILADLATLRWTATDQGARLPFTQAEVSVTRAAVRELAGRVRAEQGG